MNATSSTSRFETPMEKPREYAVGSVTFVICLLRVRDDEGSIMDLVSVLPFFDGDELEEAVFPLSEWPEAAADLEAICSSIALATSYDDACDAFAPFLDAELDGES